MTTERQAGLRERTVTIDFEPIRWHGLPLLTWLAAGVAWMWVALLAVLHLVGAV